MRELPVIEPDVAVQRRLQFLARSEVVALQNLLNTTVEAFHHTVGLGRLWRGQAVFDVEGGTELVELVHACRGTLAQVEEAVGEFLAIVRDNGADAQRSSAF